MKRTINHQQRMQNVCLKKLTTMFNGFKTSPLRDKLNVQ